MPNTKSGLSQIKIEFHAPEAAAKPQDLLVFKGFSAQHFTLAAAEPFDFEWKGDAHYLSLLDLSLTDGEVLLDGVPSSQLCDLRGRMTFVPSGCAASGWSAPARQANSFTALYFNPPEMMDELSEHYASVELYPALYFEDPSLRGTLEKLRSLMLSQPLPAGRLYGETLGVLGIVELLRLQRAGTRKPIVAKGGLSRHQETLVRTYIEEHLHHDVSLFELAALAGLTRFHFARAFKISVGQPPHQYLLRRRVERARDVLLQTDLGLQAVAEKVGFKSASLFSRTFRKLVGISPGNLRRLSGNGYDALGEG
jgi:AraC family transcriptional regulator